MLSFGSSNVIFFFFFLYKSIHLLFLFWSQAMSKEHIKNPTGTLRDTATVMAIVSLIFQLSITGWGMTAWELNKKQEYISVMEDGSENKNSSQLCHFGFSSSITSCLVYSLKFISNSKRWRRQFIICRMCHWTLFISVNLGYACFVSDVFFL